MIYRSSFNKDRTYFHLTIRLSRRKLTQTQLQNLWNDIPSRFRNLHFVSLHSCVLMSNHLHALCSVEDSYFDFLNLSVADEFKKFVFLNEVELDQDFIHIKKIESFAQYREAYRYIYRNPVEAGLVPLAELYEFSTLFELLGFGRKRILANDNMGMITNPFPLLHWINWNSVQNHLDGFSS